MSAVGRFVPDTLALAMLILAPAVACAEVYKCAGDGGVPIYQEMPCPPGKELRNFQTDPPEITILPARPRPAAAPPAAKDAPVRDARERNGAKAGNDGKSGKAGVRAGDAQERMHVHLGMTEAEVLARLGHPDVTAGSRNGGPVRWTYMPAPGDPETTTALVLTKGVVTDIERKVVKK